MTVKFGDPKSHMIWHTEEKLDHKKFIEVAFLTVCYCANFQHWYGIDVGYYTVILSAEYTVYFNLIIIHCLIIFWQFRYQIVYQSLFGFQYKSVPAFFTSRLFHLA